MFGRNCEGGNGDGVVIIRCAGVVLIFHSVSKYIKFGIAVIDKKEHTCFIRAPGRAIHSYACRPYAQGRYPLLSLARIVCCFQKQI
jgi:hypothetical protein